jgi:hypothetical protein
VGQAAQQDVLKAMVAHARLQDDLLIREQSSTTSRERLNTVVGRQPWPPRNRRTASRGSAGAGDRGAYRGGPRELTSVGYRAESSSSYRAGPSISGTQEDPGTSPVLGTPPANSMPERHSSISLDDDQSAIHHFV